MAKIYVAHKYEGDTDNIANLGIVLRELQIQHPENTYFSPLHNFSYLDYYDMPYEQILDCCKQWIQDCDKLLVIGEVSTGVQLEIEEAEKHRVEIEYLDEEIY